MRKRLKRVLVIDCAILFNYEIIMASTLETSIMIYVRASKEEFQDGIMDAIICIRILSKLAN